MMFAYRESNYERENRLFVAVVVAALAWRELPVSPEEQ
jgi:hypothetical protein